MRIQVNHQKLFGYVKLIGKRGQVIRIEGGGAAQILRVDQIFCGQQVTAALTAGTVGCVPGVVLISAHGVHEFMGKYGAFLPGAHSFAQGNGAAGMVVATEHPVPGRSPDDIDPERMCVSVGIVARHQRIPPRCHRFRRALRPGRSPLPCICAPLR